MAADDRLAALEDALLASPSSYASATAVLEYLDEHPSRAPLLEARAALCLCRSHPARLGDRVWDVRERALVASLDAGDGEAARECLVELKRRFGAESDRVSALEGMSLEAAGRFGDAERLYGEVLKRNPAHAVSMQRRACARWAAGNANGAVEAMNEYVAMVPGDHAAWAELAEWYLADEKLALAKFCAEELLLLQPHSYAYSLQYAEILYTLGGDKNFVRARHYFAQSLELKPEGNLRALYGLCAALRAKRPAADAAARLPAWVVDRIEAEYRTAAPAQLDRVRRWLGGGK